jgi:hypothetical protein
MMMHVTPSNDACDAEAENIRAKNNVEERPIRNMTQQLRVPLTTDRWILFPRGAA